MSFLFQASPSTLLHLAFLLADFIYHSFEIRDLLCRPVDIIQHRPCLQFSSGEDLMYHCNTIVEADVLFGGLSCRQILLPFLHPLKIN